MSEILATNPAVKDNATLIVQCRDLGYGDGYGDGGSVMRNDRRKVDR